MKLAEALALRADTQVAIDQMTDRAVLNVRYQEGEEPPENSQELMDEALAAAIRLGVLVANINRTNTLTILEGGQSLTEALAERDSLRHQMRILEKVGKAAGKDEYGMYGARRTRSELRDIVGVDVRALRQRQSDIAAELREIDNAIQQAGWTVSLEEREQ